jgi:hypothetical protein
LASWQKDWTDANDRVLTRFEPEKFKLETERDCLIRSKPSLEEIRDMKRRIAEHEQETQRHLDHTARVWNRMRKSWQDELTLCQEASVWVRSAASNLKKIKVRFTQDLERLELLQEDEHKRLFPPTVDSVIDPPEQGRPDLNQAIASALASHAVPASPADCPFLRGYGDDPKIESTRSEKSGSKDWNLLGFARHRSDPGEQ